MRRLAKNYLIKRDAVFDGDNLRFPTTEEIGKVATRLGEDDRRIMFETEMSGPFGARIDGLTLPHHLVRGGPDDPLAPVRAEVDQGVLRFQYGDAEYLYDRLGLRASTTLCPGRQGES